MRILLLGKNGQVGTELQAHLMELGEVIALDRNGSEQYCGDLANLSGLRETIASIKPDVIVNAAAYTAVDKAESDQDLANLINNDAVAVLAQEAKKLDALLVHYSTDYVFNGTGDTPWLETDQTAPLNYYGQTKLAGEQAIQAADCKYLIFRTSWVYGKQGNNFAKTMLKLAKERDSLSIIEDQIGAPTSAELIAGVTVTAIQKSLANESLLGIYHLAPTGFCSWFEYASYVIELARTLGVELQVNDIKGIPSSEYKTAAIRPLNSRLNTNKLQQNFQLSLPHWKIGVEQLVKGL